MPRIGPSISHTPEWKTAASLDLAITISLIKVSMRQSESDPVAYHAILPLQLVSSLAPLAVLLAEGLVDEQHGLGRQ